MTEQDIRKLFSLNLKRLRGRWALSQLALANKADLTHNFVNDIENGKKWISPKTMAKLTEALDIEPHELLLPDLELKQEEVDRLSNYIDDFSDSLIRSVQDLKARYLQFGGDDGKK
ncbi:MAG: helix-turn-helix domain-containing protein [Spirochaetaceae bacterium]|jgi:transcriptional regulator with XRE-family HTH domain|nr:helix-turn-helix domain-containing protein [Spirochaetaceae bacterium]